MSISLDKNFGIHAQALQIRAKRAELLASNMANADTPNYLARDIDFRAALSEQMSSQSMRGVSPSTSHINHIQQNDFEFANLLQYRIPLQSSLDGNTVDLHIEQAGYAENALRYQASLNFLDGNIKSIKKALSEG